MNKMRKILCIILTCLMCSIMPVVLAVDSTELQDRQKEVQEQINKTNDELSDLKMDKNLIHRGLNDGFSGGERKKNEVLQLKILEPSLIILDELDSGLDVDSLKIVSENISDYINKNKDTAVLIITHYPKILQYLPPDFVHILYNGKIAYTSTKELALEIEKNGYKNIINKSNDIDGND